MQPTVVVSNAKHLFIDLCYVNQFLQLQKFKYEGLALVPQLFNKGEFFVTFDLKSRYHHVDIQPLPGVLVINSILCLQSSTLRLCICMLHFY